MPLEKIKEERTKMQKDWVYVQCERVACRADEQVERESQRAKQELDDLESEYKASSDLFEKQKEEAMATMKKSEDLKQLDITCFGLPDWSSNWSSWPLF